MNKAGKTARPGFSLIEILVAMTVLLLASLIIFQMLQVVFAASVHIDYQSLAGIRAEQKLEEIRKWAYEEVGGISNYYRFWTTGSGAAPFDGLTEDSAGEPPFTIHTTTSPQLLYTPTSDCAVKQELRKAARKIKVTVSWTEGGRSRSLSMVSYVAEPTRPLANLTIDPSSDMYLKVGDTADFTVSGYDDTSSSYDDLVFLWYVNPETATGTIVKTGEKTAQFTARSAHPSYESGSIIYDPGTCRVTVRARGGGREIWGYSGRITISPP